MNAEKESSVRTSPISPHLEEGEEVRRILSDASEQGVQLSFVVSISAPRSFGIIMRKVPGVNPKFPSP